MFFRQLQYLIALSKEEHFGRAADRVGEILTLPGARRNRKADSGRRQTESTSSENTDTEA